MVANFITSFDNISRLCGPKINFMSSSLYNITINIYHWHFLTVFLTKYKLNFVITVNFLQAQLILHYGTFITHIF